MKENNLKLDCIGVKNVKYEEYVQLVMKIMKVEKEISAVSTLLISQREKMNVFRHE